MLCWIYEIREFVNEFCCHLTIYEVSLRNIPLFKEQIIINDVSNLLMYLSLLFFFFAGLALIG